MYSMHLWLFDAQLRGREKAAESALHASPRLLEQVNRAELDEMKLRASESL